MSQFGLLGTPVRRQCSYLRAMTFKRPSCSRRHRLQSRCGDTIAQAVMTRYLVSALKYADAAALLVPAMPDLMHAKEVAPRLMAFCSPARRPTSIPSATAQIIDDAPGPFDPGRDETTAHLIEAMLEARQADLWHLPWLSGTECRVRRHAAARHGREPRSHPAPCAEP